MSNKWRSALAQARIHNIKCCLTYLPEKDSDLNINLSDPRLSRLNNASHILKRKHFVCGSGSHHFLSNKGSRFEEWYHHTSLIRVNTSSVSFFWKVYHLIGLQTVAECLDLLETLQEHREQLLNVLFPVILTTGLREEDLQTILPYVRELGCCGTIHHASGWWRGWSCWGLTSTTKNGSFRSHNVKRSLDQWLVQ